MFVPRVWLLIWSLNSFLGLPLEHFSGDYLILLTGIVRFFFLLTVVIVTSNFLYFHYFLLHSVQNWGGPTLLIDFLEFVCLLFVVAHLAWCSALAHNCASCILEPGLAVSRIIDDGETFWFCFPSQVAVNLWCHSIIESRRGFFIRLSHCSVPCVDELVYVLLIIWVRLWSLWIIGGVC